MFPRMRLQTLVAVSAIFPLPVLLDSMLDLALCQQGFAEQAVIDAVQYRRHFLWGRWLLDPFYHQSACSSCHRCLSLDKAKSISQFIPRAWGARIPGLRFSQLARQDYQRTFQSIGPGLASRSPRPTSPFDSEGLLHDRPKADELAFL